MFMLSHPLLWLGHRLNGTKLSNSARVRGGSNLHMGKRVRIGRQCELNASKGSITLGDGANIGPFSLIESRGGHVSIGAGTNVSPYMVAYGHGGLNIGERCIIGPGVSFIPANHNFDDTDTPIIEQGETCKGIEIGNNVWIAARVVVLDGVRIGEGSVIGAGAVVNADIPPFSVAVGVPAKVIRSRKV